MSFYLIGIYLSLNVSLVGEKVVWLVGFCVLFRSRLDLLHSCEIYFLPAKR